MDTLFRAVSGHPVSRTLEEKKRVFDGFVPDHQPIRFAQPFSLAKVNVARLMQTEDHIDFSLGPGDHLGISAVDPTSRSPAANALCSRSNNVGS
jgi:hypothetical protein